MHNNAAASIQSDMVK